MKKYKTSKNPFNLTGYYGQKYFCDREKELNEIDNHLNNERNIVLYGWRRLGKTGLIVFGSGVTMSGYPNQKTKHRLGNPLRCVQWE